VAFSPSAAVAGPEGPGPLVFELGSSDPVRIRLGASVMARGQLRDEAERTAAIIQRTRAELQVRWRFLGTFVQLGDSRVWGEAGTLAPSPPSFGVHQGYLSLGGRDGDFGGSFRVGRMQHVFGSGYLISNRPFHPNQQAFDAASLRLHWRMLDFDLFAAMTAAPARYEYEIGGEMLSATSPGDFLTAGLVRVSLHRTAVIEAAAVTHSESITAEDPERSRFVVAPSLRFSGSALDAITYEAEGFFQAGRWDGQRHRAWAGHAELGWGRFGRDVEPAVTLGYTIASGDRCTAEPAPDPQGLCSDDVHRAFSPMFGYRARLLGRANLFEVSNVRALTGSARINFEDHLKFRVDYHWMQVHEATGAWWRVNGAPIASAPLVATDDGTNTVGHEVNFIMDVIPWAPFTIQVAYAPFFRAGLGARVIPERVRHFAWMQLQVAF
jgi:hypothetical protein